MRSAKDKLTFFLKEGEIKGIRMPLELYELLHYYNMRLIEVARAKLSLWQEIK
ncbi:unnamed protein product [marine sediment metagenome]|uniref:Uncharacterized protein n=1 Tax=marine sediment metagenome TaxID=412755 RepID=X1FSV1_9ZZZZ